MSELNYRGGMIGLAPVQLGDRRWKAQGYVELGDARHDLQLRAVFKTQDEAEACLIVAGAEQIDRLMAKAA